MDNKIEELKKIHYEFKSLIESKNWVKLNRRMKDIRFNHDINKSKTVLIITQQFINQPEILEERYLLYKWFMNDLGLVYYNIPIFKNSDVNTPEKYKNND